MYTNYHLSTPSNNANDVVNSSAPSLKFLIPLGLFLTRHPNVTLHHVLFLILLICLVCLAGGAVWAHHRVSHLVVPQILAQPGTVLLLPWAMPLIWATTWSLPGVVVHPPLVTHSLRELYSRSDSLPKSGTMFPFSSNANFCWAWPWVCELWSSSALHCTSHSLGPAQLCSVSLWDSWH